MLTSKDSSPILGFRNADSRLSFYTATKKSIERKKSIMNQQSLPRNQLQRTKNRQKLCVSNRRLVAAAAKIQVLSFSPRYFIVLLGIFLQFELESFEGQKTKKYRCGDPVLRAPFGLPCLLGVFLPK
jgi:hypothetical protein